jgi:hypothetical protein
VVNIDKDEKIVHLANGQTIQYDALVSTMPLDITLQWLGQKEWAETLSHRCTSCQEEIPDDCQCRRSKCRQRNFWKDNARCCSAQGSVNNTMALS